MNRPWDRKQLDVFKDLQEIQRSWKEWSSQKRLERWQRPGHEELCKQGARLNIWAFVRPSLPAPPIHMLKLNPQCDGIRGGPTSLGVLRVEPSWMGSVPLQKKPRRSPRRSLLPHRKATYEPGRGLFPDTRSVGTLILNFPGSRMSEINFCCLWGSLNKLRE